MRRFSMFFALLAVMIFFGACEDIQDEINEATKRTEEFTFDLTEDWVPLYALGTEQYQLNAVCNSELMTVDQLIETFAADQYDNWVTIREFLNEVQVKEMVYRITANRSAGGSLEIFLVDVIPQSLELPNGIHVETVIQQLGLDLDSLLWRVVDQDDLDDADQIGEIDVPDGEGVGEWTNIRFVNDGQKKLEEAMLHYNDEFAFCLKLDMEPHGPTSTLPALKLKLQTTLRVPFTPV